MVCLAMALLIAGLHGHTWAWIVALILAAPEVFFEVLG